MEQVAPAGPVYQAGTLSGNPLAMSAGLATLQALKKPGTYEELEQKSARLAGGLQEVAARHGVDTCFCRVGSMSCTYFTKEEVFDFPTALTSDVNRFRVYYKTMLENGVYLAPSQFEAGFVSLAHSEEDIARTLAAADAAFAAAAGV
jgi:glutamate-1-semialdehyde 2,1-aminomutase